MSGSGSDWTIKSSARVISPPPLRRHKLVAEEESSSDAALPHGSSIAPDLKHLRVYSWNINGIQSFLQPSMASFLMNGPSDSRSGTRVIASLRDFLRRHNWPQILHLQEVKISPTDQATQRAVERAINHPKSDEDEPEYSVSFCLPTDKYNATGFGRKVHGVATIIRDDFRDVHVTRVREVDWDLEGRVLVVETKDKLALFNVYSVNGTTYDYRDPDTGQVRGTRHDRKLAFHRLLVEEGLRLEQSGFRLVIAGDLNVAPAPIDGHPKLRTFPYQHVINRADFQTRFLLPPSENRPDGCSLNAVDSFRYLHPDKKAYSWISRSKEWLSSCDRVDLILLSRTLVEIDHALKHAGMLMTEVDRGPSDHVPIFVALDVLKSNDSEPD